MAGPLSGIRILEIAGIGPGPFAAMLLADLGADILRIDRAAAVREDPASNPADVMGRGRRSAALDLKHPEAREALLRPPMNGPRTGDRIGPCMRSIGCTAPPGAPGSSRSA